MSYRSSRHNVRRDNLEGSFRGSFRSVIENSQNEYSGDKALRKSFSGYRDVIGMAIDGSGFRNPVEHSQAGKDGLLPPYQEHSGERSQ
jgi:hypothetical protein